MKKVFLIVACLCLLCSAAFAEGTIELKEEDFAEVAVEGGPQELEIPGLCTMSFWVPSFLSELDPGLIEGQFKPTALYVSEDQVYGLAIFLSETDDLEGYLNMMMTEGGGANPRNVMINDISCLGYEVEENDMECLIYPVTDNVLLTFSCSPLNGDDAWDTVKGKIFASIRSNQ